MPKTLILPVSGRSSRYPGMKPKWLLVHPRGTLMLTESIRGLEPKKFDKILIIALKTHEEDFQVCKTIETELIEEYGLKKNAIKFVLLEQGTRSQPETVYEGIRQAGITGQIFIRDADNYFSIKDMPEGNFIAVSDLTKCEPLVLDDKSYAQISSQGGKKTLSDIIEKKIISNTFSSGGYAFRNANEFCENFEKLKGASPLYISSIISKMMGSGSAFDIVETSNFEDWGTHSDWVRFKKKYATLFVELDGVLVLDSGKYFEPKWGSTEALRRNVATINSLYDSGKKEIIIISSRKESCRGITEEQLRKNNIKYHKLLLGLSTGCKRVLVSGFSESTPFPAALAINIKTDDDRLDELLD